PVQEQHRRGGVVSPVEAVEAKSIHIDVPVVRCPVDCHGPSFPARPPSGRASRHARGRLESRETATVAHLESSRGAGWPDLPLMLSTLSRDSSVIHLESLLLTHVTEAQRRPGGKYGNSNRVRDQDRSTGRKRCARAAEAGSTRPARRGRNRRG